MSPDAQGAPQLHTTSAPPGGGEAEGVPPRGGERPPRCSLGEPLDILREWHGFAPIARQVTLTLTLALTLALTLILALTLTPTLTLTLTLTLTSA